MTWSNCKQHRDPCHPNLCTRIYPNSRNIAITHSHMTCSNPHTNTHINAPTTRRIPQHRVAERQNSDKESSNQLSFECDSPKTRQKTDIRCFGYDETRWKTRQNQVQIYNKINHQYRWRKKNNKTSTNTTLAGWSTHWTTETYTKTTTIKSNESYTIPPINKSTTLDTENKRWKLPPLFRNSNNSSSSNVHNTNICEMCLFTEDVRQTVLPTPELKYSLHSHTQIID